MGVRVIELDVWDGGTLTKPITFEACVRTIGEEGFLSSSMPVCIALENHCCAAG